jgi:hypothetical protein
MHPATTGRPPREELGRDRWRKSYQVFFAVPTKTIKLPFNKVFHLAIGRMAAQKTASPGGSGCLFRKRDVPRRHKLWGSIAMEAVMCGPR